MEGSLLIKIFHLIRKYRIILSIILLIVCGYFTYKLGDLKLDNTVESWFVEDDPALVSYRSFLETFGNDEVVITTLFDTTSVFNRKRISELKTISLEFKKIRGISQVLSYSEIPVAAGLRRNLYIDDFIGTDDDSLKTIRSKTANLKSLNRLIGKDGKTFIIYSVVDTIPDIDKHRGRIIQQIDSICKQYYDEVNKHVNHGGVGVIFEALNQETINSSSVFILLSYLLVFVLIYLYTKRIFWSLLSIAAVTFSVIITFGIMVTAGKTVNMVSTALPPLIMALSAANIMHLSAHLSQSDQQPVALRALFISLSVVGIPLIFNALTTSGGFLSLTSAKMAITRDYGIFAAIGVLSVMLFSVFFTLVFLKKAVPRNSRSNNKNIIGLYVQRLMFFAIRNKRMVIITFVVVTGLSVIGINKIIVDTYTIDFFPDKHKVKTDSKEIEERFGNYVPLEFMIQSDKKLLSLGFLAQLSRYQEKLKLLKDVGPSFTIVDIINDVKLRSEKEEYQGIVPIEKMNPIELNYILEEIQGFEIIDKFISDEGRTIRLTVNIPMSSAKEMKTYADTIITMYDDFKRENVSIEPTGYLPLYSEITSNVLNDQVKSFAIAFVVIIFLMALVLRSFKLTLIAVPLNLIPVAMVLGFMGFFGIRLDIATVTVAAVVLGIIVDDSIHILYHCKKNIKKFEEFEDLIMHISVRTGKAVVGSGIALIGGFGVIAMAGIRSLSYTGLLIAVAVFFALLTDLILFPAITGFLYKKKFSSYIN